MGAGKEAARDQEESAVESLGQNVGQSILASQGLRGRLRAYCAARGISEAGGLEFGVEAGRVNTAGMVGAADGGDLRADMERFRRDLDEFDAAVPDRRQHTSVTLCPPVGATAAAAAAAAEAVATAEGGKAHGDAALEQHERERSFYMRFYPHVFR